MEIGKVPENVLKRAVFKQPDPSFPFSHRREIEKNIRSRTFNGGNP